MKSDKKQGNILVNEIIAIATMIKISTFQVYS